MTIRKHIAGFLALLLLVGTVFSMPQAGYAAASDGSGYRSDLVLNGAQQDTYYAGDEIQLDLKLVREDGGSFGVRLYDNEITVDTSRLEVLTCTAPAISGVSVSINSNYQVNQEAHTQTIKWLYTAQNPKTSVGTLDLGSIRLRVKTSPAEGNAAIGQSVQGMADQAGTEITNVAGNGLSLAVTNDLPSYHVGLRVTDGAKNSYAPGESFTLQAYVTSSSIQFHADLASTTILLDDERFAVTSALWGGGVTGSYDQTEGANRKVTMVYAASGSAAQSEVVLGTFTIKVKEEAAIGAVTLGQKNTAITEGGAESQKVSAGSLPLTINNPGSAEMKLTPRGGLQVAKGESVTLDLSISMEKSYAPRMIHSVLVYDSNQLELVKLEPLSDKSSVAEDSEHQIKWVYFDQTPADRTGTLTLGSITLKAKDSATAGSTVIGLLEYDLVVKNGEDSQVITNLTAPDTAMEIVEAFDYQIGLDKSGSVVIPQAEEGYTSPGSVSAAVTNLGTGRVTGLKAALSGTNADSFELSTLSAIELAPGSETTSAGAATFTVTPKTGLAAGTYTAEVTVTADKELSKSFTVSFTVVEKTTAGGVTVSGRFTSYDPKKEATITLTNDADASKVYTVKVVEESGRGEQTADFTLEGVEAGTYTLLIAKPAHLSLTVKNIIVGETDVDLKLDSRAGVQNMNLYCGDVRAEGAFINADDSGVVTNKANFNLPVSAAQDILCDLNGDGVINADDSGILRNAKNFNKSPLVIE